MSKSTAALAAEDLARVTSGELTAETWIQVHAKRLVTESESARIQVEELAKLCRTTSGMLTDATRFVGNVAQAIARVRSVDVELSNGTGKTPLTLARWRTMVNFYADILRAVFAMGMNRAAAQEASQPLDPVALLDRVVALVEHAGADSEAVKRVRDEAEKLKAGIDPSKKEIN